MHHYRALPLALVLFLAVAAASQTPPSTGLYPIAVSGWDDDLGEWTTRWGWIDATGTVVVEPQLDAAYVFPLREGRARIMTGEYMYSPVSRYGFIDENGQVVIEPIYVQAADFHDERARVKIGVDEAGRYGYIDPDGVLVIPAVYEWGTAFDEGFAIVTKMGDVSVVIDKEGREVATLPDSAVAWDPFAEGLAPIAIGQGRDRRSGYVDATGQWAIPPQFGRASPFSEGLAAVSFDENGTERWVYIDRDGRRVITLPEDVQEADSFHEGRALVAVGEPGSDPIGWTYGYIDRNGAWVHEPAFIKATSYTSGRALALDDVRLTWVILNESGEEIADTGLPGGVACDPLGDGFNFEAFDGALARFESDICGDAWPIGFVDRSGRIVWGADE